MIRPTTDRMGDAERRVAREALPIAGDQAVARGRGIAHDRKTAERDRPVAP